MIDYLIFLIPAFVNVFYRLEMGSADKTRRKFFIFPAVN
jgi:hypothetical protein